MSKPKYIFTIIFAVTLFFCGSLVFQMFFSADSIQRVQAAAPVKIACVGDSITRGTNASKPTFTYPSQLGDMLGSNYIVQNFGDSGKGVLKNCSDNGNNPTSYWDSSQFTSSKSFAPDYIFIMLGSNDAKDINWKKSGNKNQFVSDYKEMIAAYKALPSHPTVVIATPPTAYENSFGVPDSVISGEMNVLVKQLAAATGCTVIDINAFTKNIYWNFPDGLHPNDVAYKLIASKIAAYFDVHIDVEVGTEPPKNTSSNSSDGYTDVDRPEYDDSFLQDGGSLQEDIPNDTDLGSDFDDEDDDGTVSRVPVDDEESSEAPAGQGRGGKRNLWFWIVMIGGPVVILVLAFASYLVITGRSLPSLFKKK